MNSGAMLAKFYDENNVSVVIRGRIDSLILRNKNTYRVINKAAKLLKQYSLKHEDCLSFFSPFFTVRNRELLVDDNLKMAEWSKAAGSFMLVDLIQAEDDFLDLIAEGGASGVEGFSL